MDKSDVITLITQSRTQNDYGVWETTETTSDIYAQVESVSQSEFFEGGRNGLNPAYKFIVYAFEYNGETIISYNNERFGVYRTYRTKTDMLELYVERKGGTNG